MLFTDEQLQRYRRNLLLKEIGIAGQNKLMQAKVFIVGAGGLGSPVGYYLSAAGVGTIALADNDKVALGNLQRQIAHSIHTLGQLKVESARHTFLTLNPEITIIPVRVRAEKENIISLINGYDVIADCSDNYATRFLINDACVISGTPLVTGAVHEFEGQLTAVIPGDGPCYRCLFEGPPPADAIPSQSDTGILGAVAGVIGTLQACEILKLITGAGDILRGELLIFNALTSFFRKVKIPRNPECPACGKNPSLTSPGAEG